MKEESRDSAERFGFKTVKNRGPLEVFEQEINTMEAFRIIYL